jgi:glucose dehydrogenase
MTFESLVYVCFILSVSLIFLSGNAFTSGNAFASGGEGSFSGQGYEQKIEQLKDSPSQKTPSSNQNVLYVNDSKSTSGSSPSSTSEIGTELKNMDNWITVNHDIYGSRESNQTSIKKDNVASLQVEWRLINNAQIQDPPIIIGNKGYVQDYTGTVIAFDSGSGQTLWKVRAGTGPTMGLTFSNGVVFAATGYNATVVAINATDGKILWQSLKLGHPESGYNIPSGPIVWKDYVIAGSAAGGDVPNGVGMMQGNITALNATDGKILWNLQTTVGEWVEPNKAPPYNGDASAWSGGSLDPETGIMYIPLGSPSPNFNASTRQETPNLYANHMVAVNITDGKMIWATPFVESGTVLDVKVPDTHDWDVSWGSSISKVTFDNGTEKKIVVGHDKMGNIIAMDSATGNEIWWKTLGKQINADAIPSPIGSGVIWIYGIFNYHAVDSSSDTLYVSATNRGVNYFTGNNNDDGGGGDSGGSGGGVAGYGIPAPHTMELGLHNGTIFAMDLRTGLIKWQYNTEFPPRVSPLVTDDIVFAGYIPFTEKTSAKSNHTTAVKSGVVLALDKQTGKKLWEYNVNGELSQVGPSIGNGMLFVPTGEINDAGQPKGAPTIKGSITAFGLP